MSVYESFTQSQSKPPSPPTGNAGKAEGDSPQPAPIQKQDPQPGTPVKSVYEAFKSTQKKEPQSVYEKYNLSKTKTDQPFFYGTTDTGGTIGKSDETDSSGKPFLGFRNPGDTATSTDKTRIATVFDPTKPQKLEADTFHTPRAVEGRAALKQAMGGTYNDELDHKISLELSGSNDPENLGIEPLAPGSKNTATDALENSLAKDVASGKKSLFEAQAELAKAKGLPAPWGTDKKSWIEKTFETIKNLILPKAKAETTSTTSIYDKYKAEKKAPVTSFKSVDDFNRESGRLDIVTNEIKTQGEKLSKEKATLDTTDEAAVNRFNTEVESYNAKLTQYKTDVDTYNTSVKTFKPEEAKRPLKSEAKASLTGQSISTPQFDAKSLDVYDADGNFLKTYSGPEAYDQAYAQADKIKGSVKVTGAFGELGRIFRGASADFMSIVDDAASKAADFTRSTLDPKATKTERVAKLIDTAVTALSAPFSVLFSAGMSGAKEADPGIYHNKEIVKGLEALFLKVGEGSRIEAQSYLDATPLSQKTKDTLLPVLTNIMNTINSFAAGGALHEGGKAILPKLNSDVVKTGRVIDGEYREKGETLGLPGYKQTYPKPFAAGLSIEPVEPVGFGPKKAKAEGYKPEGDLTVKTLERLTGKTTVSKQYISDLTNNPDLKQSERDLVRSVLEEYPEGKDISVKEFAEKVQSELLPLNVNTSDIYKSNQVGFHDPHSLLEDGNFTPKFENISLAPDSKGDVANYRENIYESPIKTSAGDTHFNYQSKNYFGHSRIEDMADESTRRIIELQSDLFQKGNLENELGNKPTMGVAEVNARAEELKKLEPYRNTWYERIIREEVKKAAADGKKTLLFPTGETIAKIQGLGDTHRFIRPKVGGRATVSDLKVGNQLIQLGATNLSDHDWIITDVLGDGKFKAMPKGNLSSEERMAQYRREPERFRGLIETFDISGKVEPSNPIYRFYEKEVGRYLKNRYESTLFTDPQGVTWWKVEVKPDEKNKPVQAFKKGKVTATRLDNQAKKQGVPFNLTVDQAREVVKKIFNDKEIDFIFPHKVLPGEQSAWGRFTAGGALKNPLIEVVENNGKVSDKTLYHESFHAYFKQFMSPTDRRILLQAIKQNIATLPSRINYWSKGYEGHDMQAEEYAADAFADWMKDKVSPPGVKTIFQKILSKIKEWVRKITGLTDVFERIMSKDRSFVNKNYRTLKVESVLKKSDEELNPEPAADESKYTVASRNSAKIFDESKGQESISVAGKVYDIGDFGRNSYLRKGGIKGDRFDEKELPQTLEHVVESVPASTDPTNWRSDNTAHIAEMPDGEKRVVYTRVNARGNDEIINWHKVSNEKYLEDLKNGAPARSRTEIASLEAKQSNPLTYEGKESVPETGIEPVTPAVSGQRSTSELPRQDDKNVSETKLPVNGDKSEKVRQDLTPATRARIEKSINEEHLNSILELISESKDAAHIASILFSDFGVPIREAQTLGERLKHIKSAVNVKKVIEGDELLRKRILNDPIMQRIPEDLYYQLLSNELEGEALQNTPVRNLSKFAAKSGFYRGRLPEMPSNKASINMSEYGFVNWEDARKDYDRFTDQKARFEEEKTRLKKEVRKFIEAQKLGDMTFEWKEYIRKEKLTQAEENELARKLTTATSYRDKLKLLQQSKQGRLRLSRARLRLIDRLTYRDIPGLEQNTQLWQESQLQQIDKKYSKEFESLPKIILKEPTPVKQKVGILDYFRTPERILRKIGLHDAADMIRHGYESYMAELPGHIELLKDWDDRIKEGKNEKEYKASKARIFRFLDGTLDISKDPMSTQERRVAGEMRLYLRDWSERLNLPDDQKISHYITHIFEKGLIAKEFDEDMAKIIQEKIPGSVYDPFLQARMGAMGYIEDPIRALEAYAKRGVRKANMDPALEYLKAASGRLELSQLNYVKRFADRVNMRPTEWDNLLDNTIKQFFGYRFGVRPVATLTRGARKAVYRAMLGLNVGSAVKNLTQGVNTYSTLGEKYTLIGYTKLMTNIGSDEIATSGILGMDIIQDKTLSAYRRNLEKFDKGLFSLFNGVEYINRVAAYWGAKAKAIDEGKHEAAAIDYAKKVVRDTQFTYGSIDTPAALQSDLVKTIAQFTTFGIKQTEFLAEMLKSKNWSGLLRYIGSSLILVYFLGKAFNLSYKDFLPLSFLARFGTPPTFALPMEILKATFNSPDNFGHTPSAGERGLSLLKTAGSYLPASLQTQKTFAGAEKVFNPKTPADEVAETPANVAKALLLGPQNIDTIKDTFKGSVSRLQGLLGQKPGSQASKAESEFKSLKSMSAAEAAAAWEKINQSDPALAKRIADIAKEDALGLTPEERLIKQLNVSMGVRANYIANKLKSLADDKARAEMWSDYETKGIITKNVAPQILKILGK